MRISSLQAFQNGVQGLQRNYAAAIRTNEQISSGNRILTPADDPVASVRLLQLEQQQNMLGQYKDNLTAANNSLVQEEVTLNSVNTVMQRVRELAVQAGNGALNQNDRQAIAAELGEREDELLGLMNTRNARGEYLFAGFQGKTQPFERQADGSYAYQGDEGQRKLQIGSSLNVAISDNGKKVFENIPNSDTTQLHAKATGSTLIVSAPVVQDIDAFSGDSAFPEEGIEIRFAELPGDPKEYEVFAKPYNAATSTALQAGNVGADNQIVFRGAVVSFTGTPAGGEEITVVVKEKQGVLDTIQQLRSALEKNTDSPAGSRANSAAVAFALTNIDHAMVNIDNTRGEIGARMNMIETTQTDNEDVSLINKTVQAELREVDYPEALSKLAFQSVVLEAAQQSFVKISQLNLFDKIR
mgnify:CR=1 FL=1